MLSLRKLFQHNTIVSKTAIVASKCLCTSSNPSSQATEYKLELIDDRINAFEVRLAVAEKSNKSKKWELDGFVLIVIA